MHKIGPVHPIGKWNKNSTYLVLISPDKIPHLILVHQGLYYSLTYKESILGEDFQTYFTFLMKGRFKLLWVELINQSTDFKTVFEQYSHVDTSKVTCLQPIRNSLLPHSAANFVFELIPELAKAGWVKRYFHTNLFAQLNQSLEFTLNEYTKEDIFTYIQQLNKKYVER
jgi:hypothetical protein